MLSDGGTARMRPIRPDDGPRIVDFHARQSPESIYFRYFTPHPHLTDDEVDPPHPRRLRRPDGVRRPARRRDGRRRPLRPLAAAVRGRGGVLRRRPPPGPGHRHRAARVPGRGGPAGRHQRLHGHRAAVEPRMVRGVPAGRVRGAQHVRRGRDRGPPRPAADARRPRPPSRPGRSGPRPRPCACCSPPARWRSSAPGASGAASATPCCATCWPTSSTGPCTRSTPTPTTSAASGRCRASATSTARSTWRWSSCPPPRCPGVIEECGRKGVKAVIVISAGFAESGPEGAALSAAALRAARRFGIRLLGPNCLGVINTDPDVRLHATFATPEPAPGPGGPAVRVRHHRRRPARPHRRGRPGRVVVRRHRQPGRRVGQRPAAVLGRRRPHRARAALPRVVRQRPQVQPHRPRAVAPQADRGGARAAGAARAYPSDDGELPAETLRRPARADRRDPGRHAGPAARRGPGAGLPAAARRATGWRWSATAADRWRSPPTPASTPGWCWPSWAPGVPGGGGRARRPARRGCGPAPSTSGSRPVRDDLDAGAGRAARRRRRRQRAGRVRAGAPPVDRRPGGRRGRGPGRRRRARRCWPACSARTRRRSPSTAGRRCRCSTSPTTPPTRSAGSPRYARWRAAPEGELVVPDGADACGGPARVVEALAIAGRGRLELPTGDARRRAGGRGVPIVASPVVADDADEAAPGGGRARVPGGGQGRGPSPAWRRPRPAASRSTSTTRPSCGPRSTAWRGRSATAAWPVVVQPMAEPGRRRGGRR